METIGRPRMRTDIQPVPVSVRGSEMVTFLDHLRLAEEGFAVDRRILPALAMMDGTNDLREIQACLVRLSGGCLVSLDDVKSLVDRLDEANLLDTDRFRAARRLMVDAFVKARVREPALAGRSYHADPQELVSLIESVERDLGPCEGEDPRGIAGILAPHIDIGVALRAYVDVYRRIKGCPFEVVIVLGVNHQGSSGIYCLTKKDFATPFGIVKNNRDLVGRLGRDLPEGTLAQNDFDHKMEHSIEFQLVFLSHYLGTGFSVVPVLCGSIHEFFETVTDPFSEMRLARFRDNLMGIVREGGDRVLVVAGVDFSHVGRKFGHDRPALHLVDAARSHDRKIIASLVDYDPWGIYRTSRDAKDWSHVCGLSAMILMAAVLEKGRARVLCHETYEEPATQSAVTYASMVFGR